MISAQSLIVDDLEHDIVFPAPKLSKTRTGSDMTTSILNRLDESKPSNVITSIVAIGGNVTDFQTYSSSTIITCS